MKSLIANKYFLLTVLILSSFSSILNVQKKNAFILSSPQTTAQVILDNKEVQLVHTAAGLFADDINNISGRRPEIRSVGNSQFLIKAGTLGVNKSFDNECKKAGIDTHRLKSKWEAYIIKVVSSPKSDILLVAGSNPRGTALGLMELSRMIGVSPWYWWADVRPEKKEVIELPKDLLIEDAPEVKFRGVFINDEDWGMNPWSWKNYETSIEKGRIGPKTYERVFELMLRLRANIIWPAMHDNCTIPFYLVKGNREMADRYGITIGTSHHESMNRNTSEWNTALNGSYNYVDNSKNV